MNFELVYTSAPRGIRAGTKGYCTVAFTEGMPANYVRLAESLSGYTKAEGGDIDPIAFSHYSFVVGGRRLSILSRVTRADYADYTGRKPTIAHHVVLEDAGRLSEGSSAQAMQLPGFFFTGWQDDPRLIKKSKRIELHDSGDVRAQHWEQLCGDGGWAGVLAHHAQESPKNPVFIVCSAGQSILPLLGEALALLPPQARWNVTFNTYFNRLPQGSSCLWRCCLPGSPALKEMRRTAGALSIDLTTPLGSAPDVGPLVECARTGVRPEWPEPVVEARAMVSPSSPVREEEKPPAEAASGQSQQGTRMQAVPVLPRTRRTPPQIAPVRKKMWPIIVVTAGVTAMVLLLIGGGVFFLSQRRTEEPSERRAEVVVEESGDDIPGGSTLDTGSPLSALPDGQSILDEPNTIVETDTDEAAALPEVDRVDTTPDPSEDVSESGVSDSQGPVESDVPSAKTEVKQRDEWAVELMRFAASEDGPWKVVLPDRDWQHHTYEFYFTDPKRPVPAEPLTLGGGLGKPRAYEYDLSSFGVRAVVSGQGISFYRTQGAVEPPYLVRVVPEKGNRASRVVWIRRLVESVTVTEIAGGLQIQLPNKKLLRLLAEPALKSNILCQAYFPLLRKPEVLPFDILDAAGSVTVRFSLASERKEGIRKAIDNALEQERSRTTAKTESALDRVRSKKSKPAIRQELRKMIQESVSVSEGRRPQHEAVEAALSNLAAVFIESHVSEIAGALDAIIDAGKKRDALKDAVKRRPFTARIKDCKALISGEAKSAYDERNRKLRDLKKAKDDATRKQLRQGAAKEEEISRTKLREAAAEKREEITALKENLRRFFDDMLNTAKNDMTLRAMEEVLESEEMEKLCLLPPHTQAPEALSRGVDGSEALLPLRVDLCWEGEGRAFVSLLPPPRGQSRARFAQ